jgi:hypothetical protein
LARENAGILGRSSEKKWWEEGKLLEPRAGEASRIGLATDRLRRGRYAPRRGRWRPRAAEPTATELGWIERGGKAQTFESSDSEQGTPVHENRGGREEGRRGRPAGGRRRVTRAGGQSSPSLSPSALWQALSSRGTGVDDWGVAKDGQTGLARWAGTGPTRESTARKRPGPGLPRARAGTARPRARARAGSRTRRPGTGTARSNGRHGVGTATAVGSPPSPDPDRSFRTETLAIYSRGAAEP